MLELEARPIYALAPEPTLPVPSILAGEVNHACPYSDAPGFIRYLRGNMRRGKDNMICSEGPEGSGKSTTSGQIIRRLEPRYDLEADSIFSPRHLLDVLEDCRKGRVFNLDEAINIFHNQDWSTWLAKGLTKLIRQMRIMKGTWVVNVPDFEGLHPYLRDYRIRQRFYHWPVFDEDGMGNGPPVPLWKSERFNYKENRVTTKWVDLEFDMHVDSLDDDPQHQAYEAKKEQNFRELARLLKDRYDMEEEKDLEKAGRKPAGRKRRAKGGAKRAKTASPPTT